MKYEYQIQEHIAHMNCDYSHQFILCTNSFTMSKSSNGHDFDELERYSHLIFDNIEHISKAYTRIWYILHTLIDAT